MGNSLRVNTTEELILTAENTSRGSEKTRKSSMRKLWK